ncbi:hypothetical protein HDV00_001188 [Rhizophlyctis rosea]|nr:hypothetical protein HDV00_001188 [Rhizophlyctis rosea]
METRIPQWTSFLSRITSICTLLLTLTPLTHTLSMDVCIPQLDGTCPQIDTYPNATILQGSYPVFRLHGLNASYLSTFTDPLLFLHIFYGNGTGAQFCINNGGTWDRQIGRCWKSPNADEVIMYSFYPDYFAAYNASYPTSPEDPLPLKVGATFRKKRTDWSRNGETVAIEQINGTTVVANSDPRLWCMLFGDVNSVLKPGDHYNLQYMWTFLEGEKEIQRGDLKSMLVVGNGERTAPGRPPVDVYHFLGSGSGLVADSGDPSGASSGVEGMRVHLGSVICTIMEIMALLILHAV